MEIRAPAASIAALGPPPKESPIENDLPGAVAGETNKQNRRLAFFDSLRPPHCNAPLPPHPCTSTQQLQPPAELMAAALAPVAKRSAVNRAIQCANCGNTERTPVRAKSLISHPLGAISFSPIPSMCTFPLPLPLYKTARSPPMAAIADTLAPIMPAAALQEPPDKDSNMTGPLPACGGG